MAAYRPSSPDLNPLHRQSNSPISSLPFELLAQVLVFTEALEEYQTLTSVVQVCRFWKDVAYDTPELWTRLTLTPVKFRRPKVTAYLARAKKYPLRLTLQLASIAFLTNRKAYLDQIFHFIKAQGNPLATLDVLSCVAADVHVILRYLLALLSRSAIRKMRHFGIRTGDHTPGPPIATDDYKTFMDVLLVETPQLTSMNSPPWLLPEPPHSLTTGLLDLDVCLRSASDRIPGLLRTCSRLESLTIGCGNVQYLAWQTEAPELIQLPSLRSLSLKHIPSALLVKLLKSLVLPSLRSLSLASMSFRTEAISAFTELNLSSPLEQLQLLHARFKQTSVIEFLMSYETTLRVVRVNPRRHRLVEKLKEMRILLIVETAVGHGLLW